MEAFDSIRRASETSRLVETGAPLLECAPMTIRLVSLGSFALVVLTLASACSETSTAVDQGSPDMRRHYDLTGMRSTIGDACQAGKAPRGTCSGDETICFTDGQYGFPGGVCTQDCTKLGCPNDAV